jgi:hypothetical protein
LEIRQKRTRQTRLTKAVSCFLLGSRYRDKEGSLDRQGSSIFETKTLRKSNEAADTRSDRLDGNGLQIAVNVDAKGTDKLLKTIHANLELLRDDDDEAAD